MTGGAVVTVPSTVDVGGVPWTVARAWPHRADVALELTHPDSAHVRGAILASDGSLDVGRPTHDRRLPGLAEVARDGVVVSHRPGRRAVVRSHDARRFTKVVRPGAAAGVVGGMDAGASLAVHVSSPRLLDVADDRVVLGALPGRSLLELARSSDAGSAWGAWADVWTDVVRAEAPPTVPLHDAAAEAEVLDTWWRRAARVMDPVSHERLGHVVEDLTQRLTTGTPGRVGVAHRDLHDQQLLWAADGGIGVLDVDTACRAEVALDLGNLRAHVTLRRLQELYPETTATLARAAVDSVAAAGGVDPARVRDHELVCLARLVAVYAFRPRWRRVSATLLGHLDGAVTGGRGWGTCSMSS